MTADTAAGTQPGARMRSEIAEQPETWQALLEQEGPHLRELRDRVRARPPRLVLFVARGTSDHAALYGAYVVQTSLGLPAASASPSVVTLYDGELDLRDVLVVAVSQSGESPDLISFVDMARGNGATTLALTNAPSSGLCDAADDAVDLCAGAESAVAATKSYTAEVLALAALFAPDLEERSLVGLPELARQVLDASADPMTELAAVYRYATRVVTAARGFSSASAHETALKLMETCYISAHGMSSADLLHGPVAMLDQSVPLLCFASAGPDAAELEALVERARRQGVDAEVLGDGTVTGRRLPPLLPKGVLPLLRPLLEIIPAQLLAAEIAVERGHDPDAPRGLTKVTKTY
jgi:glucosamine--fructose-6-phosphate aminotransferase (isomerizing)